MTRDQQKRIAILFWALVKPVMMAMIAIATKTAEPLMATATAALSLYGIIEAFLLESPKSRRDRKDREYRESTDLPKMSDEVPTDPIVSDPSKDLPK